MKHYMSISFLDGKQCQKVLIKAGIRRKQRILLVNVSNVLCLLGPVVQSVVSLTSSLRVISLTVLADSIYNILIFFAEKM